MRLWLDNLASSIEGPEIISEQVLRIVETFEFTEAGPVVAKTGLGALRLLVAAEELREGRQTT
jgi:hypothetical protein